MFFSSTAFVSLQTLFCSTCPPICPKNIPRKKAPKSGHALGLRNSPTTAPLRPTTPKRASGNERAIKPGVQGACPRPSFSPFLGRNGDPAGQAGPRGAAPRGTGKALTTRRVRTTGDSGPRPHLGGTAPPRQKAPPAGTGSPPTKKDGPQTGPPLRLVAMLCAALRTWAPRSRCSWSQ